MHLVHRNETGRYAVVGVMFDAGEARAALETVWSHMSAPRGFERAVDLVVNAVVIAGAGASIRGDLPA